MLYNELACPYCDETSQKKKLNSWIFASYEVTRFECENCHEKFNTYESNGKIKFTIPYSDK